MAYKFFPPVFFVSEEMEEGVEEEVGIGDTNMLEIVLVELVRIFCAVLM